MSISKRRANIIHFRRRLSERYGIETSGNEVERLGSLIIGHGSKFFIKKITGTRSLHKIPIQGKEVLVIYDKNQHTLLTALPENSIDIFE